MTLFQKKEKKKIYNKYVSGHILTSTKNNPFDPSIFPPLVFS